MAEPQPLSLLLALPTEIRLKIYRRFLRNFWPIEHLQRRKARARNGRWSSNTAILAVCKLVNNEALSVLYGENLFVIALHGLSNRGWDVEMMQEVPRFGIDFTESNWLHVRRMAFHLSMLQREPYGEVTTIPPVPCLALLLQRLSYLRLVVPDDREVCYHYMGRKVWRYGEILVPEAASDCLERLGAVLDMFYGLYGKPRGFEVFTPSKNLAKYLNWRPSTGNQEARTTTTHDDDDAIDGLVLREPRDSINRGPLCLGKRSWPIWSPALEGTVGKKGWRYLFWTW